MAKRKAIRSLAAWQLMFSLILGESTAMGQADEAAGGFNTERVENEYKLTVPYDKAEEIWSYLKSRYDPQSEDFILAGVPGAFSTTFSTEEFIDTYYDTFDLTMLQQESGIRHRRRYFPDNPQHPKHGRELIQVKLNRPGDNVLNRTEIKFPVKHYAIEKREIGIHENHALIGMIKRSKRDEFLKRVAEIGIEAVNLRAILTLNQTRRRVYISRNGVAFATLTLDRVSVSKWWAEPSFYELELELNEIGYTEGTEQERAFMERVNARMQEDLMAHFPSIHQDQTPKYNKAFDLLNEEFLLWPVALKCDMPMEVAFPILAAVGFVGAVELFRRRRRHPV